MRRAQTVLMELLMETDRICRANDISYAISGGMHWGRWGLFVEPLEPVQAGVGAGVWGISAADVPLYEELPQKAGCVGCIGKMIYCSESGMPKGSSSVR